jgi:hypothetical protein
VWALLCLIQRTLALWHACPCDRGPAPHSARTPPPQVRQLVVSNRTQKQLLLKIAASVPDIKLYRSRPLADQVSVAR